MNLEEIEERLEGRLTLHVYGQEKDRLLERHPELKDVEDYVDIETLKISRQEMEKFGRLVSSPKAIARKAAENVRGNLKKQSNGSGGQDGGMSDDEYVKFWTDSVNKTRRR